MCVIRGERVRHGLANNYFKFETRTTVNDSQSEQKKIIRYIKQFSWVNFRFARVFTARIEFGRFWDSFQLAFNCPRCVPSSSPLVKFPLYKKN